MITVYTEQMIHFEPFSHDGVSIQGWKNKTI